MNEAMVVYHGRLEHDEERTRYFESKDYQVLRFWNNQVLKDIESVIKVSLHVLESYRNGPFPSVAAPFLQHNAASTNAE